MPLRWLEPQHARSCSHYVHPGSLPPIREVEALHDPSELLKALGQPGVVCLLLRHGGAHHPLVVVGGEQGEVVGQGEDLVPHAPVQDGGAPALEISPATATNEERVTSEGAAILSVNVGDASLSVSG